MKKAIIILAILFLAAPAMAQTMHNFSQATVAWDAVAVPEGATGAVKYQVYVKSDPAATTGTKVGGEVTATQALISFLPFVIYYAGVQSVFYPTGAATPETSTIAWSNVAEDCSPAGSFGFYYTQAPGKPKNMMILR
jgi:hypothetical protein